VRKAGYFSLLIICSLWSFSSFAQRGKIIRAASTSVMDPNGDGYVSKTNAGFSGDGTGYYVNEFELTMFGIPILGSGDVTGDNIGNACGITDLIPDTRGYSVYAVHDSNDNLIFRFRVGDDNPSVEAWTILLDTDGLFGANDPNSTPDNPGFELDITLIKRNNAGIYVYNIDGIDNCPNEDLFYSIDTHFQISQADESSCGDPDYFYDYYVPFSALVSKYGISSATGLRFAATTNTSATCAMSGKIADVGGVDNSLPAYTNCVSCAFVDLINNQCPTTLADLCQTCAGFEKNKVSAPHIDLPLRAGQSTVTGTTVESNIYIRVQVFTNTAPTGNPPTWGATPREEKAAYAAGNVWSIGLANPLLANDKIVAIAQKDEFSVPCGANGNNTSSTSVTVVQPNTPPVANNQLVSLSEDTQTSITLVGTDPENDPLTYSIVTLPAHGVLTGSGTNFTYTSNLNYNGSDSFTFQVSDGIFSSVVAGVVSITITPVNDAPAANNQSVTTAEDVAKAVTLTATDIDGNTLTYSIVAGPTHGTLTGSIPNLTYTPAANYNGPDNFTFKANDGTVDSNIATVSITVTAVNDAPVASAQSVTTAEDVAKAITLAGTDADGNALTYIIVASPAHGSLSGSGANRTYTPASNYNGSDNFTFKVNDGTVDSNTATISITVTAVNDAPVANNQSITTAEDVAKAITLVATDVDGNTLTYGIVTAPAHGTLTGSIPNLTYTPAANYNGPDNFTFKANDGTVDSNIATVSITVTAVNDAPVASAQSVTTAEDVAKAITLAGADADGNALTYIIVASPAHGSLSGSGANRTYTPASNYNGPDNFTFKVNDGTVNSNTATVTITVTAVNDAPVANSQNVNYVQNTAKGIVLTGSDPESDPITFAIIGLPANGILTGSAPNVTYTPNLNYTGSDNFTFRVNDGNLNSTIATVFLSIDPGSNVAPVAFDQSVVVVEDAATDIHLVASDNNIADVLIFSVVSAPVHGTLSGSGADVIYTPDPNNTQADAFTFRVFDGTIFSNTATVSITFTSVPDAPIADDQSVSTTEDTSTPITLTGSSPDGNAIVSYIVISAPLHGGLTGSGAALTYTPSANYYGADAFTFKVNDGTDSNVATVSITVTPVNDAPTATAQGVNTNEDTALPITLTGIDVDGDGLTYTLTSAAAHGIVTGSAPNLIYTPASNYHGSDSFTFTVNDGILTSGAATISITVNSVPDAPIANDQSVSATEDASTPITLTGSSPDGNSIISYTVVSGPSHGGLTGSGANLTYIPSADYNGPDVFTFKVNDGTDSNVATISVTVTPVNDAPVTVSTGIGVITNEDTPVLIALVSSDVDGDPLTYTIVTPPVHGTLSGNGSNVFYTPNANYNGPDSFTFFTNDGTANSNTGIIPITVLPVNDVPVASDDNGTTNENTALILTNVTSNDTDIDGTVSPGTVDLDLTTGGIQGSLTNIYGIWTVNTSGDVTFVPALDYSGNASIIYTVNDDLGATSNTATVTITVIGVTGLPQANSDVAVTDEDVTVIIPTVTANDVSNGGIIDPLTIDLDPSSSAPETTFTNALGTWSVDGSGNLTFTPAANYNGVAVIYYTVKDNSGSTSNSASVTVTINPINDAPVLNNLLITTSRNLPADGNAIDPSDADPDGTALVVNTTPLTPPAHGALVINSDGTFTYTPTAEYVGTDQASVEVCDSGFPLPAACASKLINFDIKPVNRPPVIIVNNQPGETMDVTTAEDTPVVFCFQTSDPDGDVVEVKSFTNVSGGGTLVPDGTGPFCYQFAPAKDYNGIAIWEAQICDNGSPSLCGKLTVTITITPVNDAPVAVRDSVNALRKTPFSGNVLLNDFDIEGDAITLSTTPVKDVMHGQVTFESDGRFRYSSLVTYRGIDSLVYKICDSGTPMGCSEGTLIINVGDLPLRVYEGVSPNGDGNNEYLQIDGIDFYTENQVRIFDRYNNEVFQIWGYNNEDRVWSGQANKGIGTDVLPEGAYFYVINLGDGSALINGFVVLKRN
jgi:gliding motility-associated-like protein